MKRILFLGDSLTQGMYTGLGFRHEVMQARPDLIAVGGCEDAFGQKHEGHPSYSIENIEELTLGSVLEHQPHWVVLLAGSNNLPTESAQDIVSHIAALVSLIRSAGVEHIFVSTLPGAIGFEREVYEVNQRLSGCELGERATLVPMGDAVDCAFMLEDENHPNEIGYSAMAKVLLNSLNNTPNGVGPGGLGVGQTPMRGVAVGEGSGFSTPDEEMAMPLPEFQTLLAEANGAATVGAAKLGITLTPAARQIALAIGLLENGYGQRKSWVITPPGAPSNNWGALLARSGQPFFTHEDKNNIGLPTMVDFAIFPTLADGFVEFYKRWASPAVLAAANAGDALRTAAAMFAQGEFTGINGTPQQRVQNYAVSIKLNADAIASTLGQPKLVKDVPPLVSTVPPVGNPPIGTMPPPKGPPAVKPREVSNSSAFLLIPLGLLGLWAWTRK